MVETNYKTLIHSWYVSILIFIYIFLSTALSLSNYTGLYPDFDFNRYHIYLLIGTFALITAGTFGSLVFRGIGKLSRWVGRKVRSD